MPYFFPDLHTAVTAAPGTGSTSLTAACAAAQGHLDVLAGLDPDGRSGLDRKHATMADVASCGLALDVPVEVVVTTTRNPFDFYLAEWHRTRTRWAAERPDAGSWVHRVPGMLRRIEAAESADFDPWLRDELGDDRDEEAQHRLNAGHVGEATVVLRMEHLNDDLARLHPALSERLGPIEHHNRTDGAPSRTAAYSAWGRERVARLHEHDLALFDYRF